MSDDGSGVLLTWKARSVQPVIALYVVGVFAVFLAVAHFGFHSSEAVSALAGAAVASVGALVPGILTRIEYRITGSGLAKRPFKEKEPKEFKEVFSWDEVSHLLPTNSGYKFYKHHEGGRGLSGFFRLHFLGSHSGEFHVESSDRREVQGIIDRQGIPLGKHASRARMDRVSGGGMG